jgi:IS1 family transposase
VAWVLGNRDTSTFKRLYQKVKHLNNCLFYTDQREVFKKVLPPERHIIGKEHTRCIERDNSNTRHHLARFTRRTKVVSNAERAVELTLRRRQAFTAPHFFEKMQTVALSIYKCKLSKFRLPLPAGRIVAFLARLPFIRLWFAGAWLFVDRDFKADDNAEHLCRWIMHNHPEQNIFFALRKGSPDWTRLRQEGFRLLNLSSLSYAFAWLHCDWLISSNRSGYITKPVWREWYADIVRHRFCFLQHGVTKDFQPGLNNPHADILITAAHAEYRSFIDDPRYVYSEREVRLTGFPRHDELLRKAENVPEPRAILIMPTWRKNLVGELMPRTGQYPYSTAFAQSEYFRAWQAVLLSQSLHDTAKRNAYTLRFFPHPYIRQQLSDFDLSGVDCPPDAGGSIQDILADTALLITDYSSIAMEVALLRRPMLYFQFDRETFFTQDHSYTKGYFDYERDGFGPVLTTAEALCARARACMEGGCRMEAVYREREEAFFAFRDQNNCRRVYNALC